MTEQTPAPTQESKTIAQLRATIARMERRIGRLQTVLRSVLDVSIKEYGSEAHVDVKEMLQGGDLAAIVPAVIQEIRRRGVNDRRWQAHTMVHREQDELLNRLAQLIAHHARSAQLIADVGRALLPPLDEPLTEESDNNGNNGNN